jgi:hypothetical protein
MDTPGIKHTADGIQVDLKAMSVFPFDQINGSFASDSSTP